MTLHDISCHLETPTFAVLILVEWMPVFPNVHTAYKRLWQTNYKTLAKTERGYLSNLENPL